MTNPKTKAKRGKGRPAEYSKGARRITVRLDAAELDAWRKKGGKALSSDIAQAFREKYL
jgi:hypothetical protein